MITACLHAGVQRLVYTSTASVVFDGSDVQNGDESMPIPRRHLDAYARTKAMAERLVLAANGVTNGVALQQAQFACK